MTLSEYKVIVEKELERRFSYGDVPQKLILESSKYSLMAGGKRLRAAFLMEFCSIFGGSIEEALPFAAAIEMIHAYSLIHDDLPCMDNDDFRRGKPTNHKVYGEAIALLAGDNLLNSAYEIMLTESMSGSKYARAGALIAEAAGAYGMIGGQVLDIQEGIRSEEDLKLMVSLKTGKLFYAACMAGAILGGAGLDSLPYVAEYAEKIGLAFQIVDDILDVKGDFEKLGKTINSDADNDKYTFVTAYGIEEAQKKADKLTDEAIEALKCLPKSEFLRDIAEKLRRRES